jgi:ferric-dicitrate binding protein FerR (iron transport regulator)
MSKQEAHREFTDRAGRFLSGELTPDERTAFLAELRKDPARQEELEKYRKIWDSAVPGAGYDLDAEWELLRKKIPGFGEAPGATASIPGQGRSVLFYSYRIAAVLLVGLVLGFSWFYFTRMRDMQRVLAKDTQVEVMLEDGTKVVLNRDSRLRYGRTFDPGERKVYLSGEAWFDVVRDTARPFLIDAGEAMVRVLGTSFNVNAYRKNPTVEITVESGLVAMSSKKDEQDQIVMKAGSGGLYHKSLNTLKLIPTSDPNSISWKTRELFFQETSLREVADLLNRVYDVNIVIVNPELASCPLTVTFRDQSLEAILHVLEQTLDLQVTWDGKEYRLDGEGCEE